VGQPPPVRGRSPKDGYAVAVGRRRLGWTHLIESLDRPSDRRGAIEASAVPCNGQVVRAAAAVPGWRVSVVSLPLPATLVGLKLALAPAGVPDAARLTVLENPLKGETVIFEVAAAPAFGGDGRRIRRDREIRTAGS